MNGSSPISAFLEKDLRDQVRRHGVVVWLDLDGHYTAFVDRLASRTDLPYAVHAFRGSHLALMLEMERLCGGTDRARVLIHLPGFNEENIRRTPLLETWAAGVRYRKKLDTLVTEAAAGLVKPELIAAFRNQPGWTLEDADRWLADLLDAPDDGGLAAHLRAMKPTALFDDLLAGGMLAGRVREPAALEALWKQASAWTGLQEGWLCTALPPHPEGEVRPADIAFAVASWVLAVEYVDDLQRPPVDRRLQAARDLPRGVVDICRQVAADLRERHGLFYQRTADETEGWLVEELAVARAEDLGRIDTFRFEEDRVLQAAIEALEGERWDAVLTWARARLDGRSFWLRESARQSAWHLVQAAARLGEALTRAGPALKATSLEGALDRYTEVGAEVDRAHRHLEQRRAALLFPQLPRFEEIRERLDAMRELVRTWADLMARDFSLLCRRQGFLPPSSLQQRTLFEEVVRPLTQEPGTTALFLVDALRYEMALDLLQEWEGLPATTVSLKARLAELPTVTEVGMNVLAPVASGGRLAPAISGGAIRGFSAGDYRVHNPETRGRAMWARAGGATCPWFTLPEVLDRDAPSLKLAVSRARLVVVHSLELDRAGENGVGPQVFDHVLMRIRSAWRLLREAGVRRFVLTADHGFLLVDETARRIPHGRKIDPAPRYVVSPLAADHTGEVRVALADLGYADVDDHLMFPESTALFDTGNRATSFVHGGNSLQERVIPVLTVTHRSALGTDTLRYGILAQAREGVAGMNCLVARVEIQAQEALAFGGTREVELALRVREDPQATVELCQVRGGARLAAGTLRATVGQEFELFFKITAANLNRVCVELYHPTSTMEVTPCPLEARFVAVGPARASSPTAAVPGTPSWLGALPAGGVRQVFEHIAAHGAITEDEVATLLGSPRAARRFALGFDEHASRLPFEVRIDTVGGIKRYVRQGSAR